MKRVGKRRKEPIGAGSFRSLHISDIHMSNNLPYAVVGESGVTDRLRDQEALWYRVFDTARRRKVEAIFVQGDLFDQRRVDAITLTTTVRTLAKTPVPMYIIPGNHDGVNTRGERFTVEALSEVPNLFYMETGDAFQPRPWLSFFPLEFAPLDKTREILAAAKLQSGATNVLLMHNSVVGCTHVGWKCEDGHGLSADEVTGRFDHVLSGHFHDPQEFGSNGLYLGAPLHLKADDAGREAGYWVMDWFHSGGRKDHFIPGGAPSFHSVDWGEQEYVGPFEANDFVRVRLSCTYSEMVKLKPAVVEYVEALKGVGVRASWFHDPVYQHSNRIVAERGSKIVSVRKQIANYVSAVDVDTTGLDEKKLRGIGLEIYDSVEGEWGEKSSTKTSGGRLLSCSGENFAGFREFEMELSDQGLVFIEGVNKDTTSATSNGACKSGLFKAIGWALYGKAIDRRVGDELIHRGEKRATVSVEIVDQDGDRYEIRRERRKQQPRLYVLKNGEPLEVSKDRLQSEIDSLIGTDWSGFRNTAMYGQGDRDRFVYPTTKDSERKAILHRILRTGVFELAHAEAKRRRLAVEKDLIKARADVERFSERIGDIDLSAIESRMESFEEDNREKARALVAAAKDLASRARAAVPDVDVPVLKKSVAKKERKIARLRALIEEHRSDSLAARKEHSELSSRIAAVDAILRSSQQSLSLLDGEKCPTCTADLGKGSSASHRRALRRAIADMESELSELSKGRETAAQAEESANDAIADAESEIDRLEGQVYDANVEIESVVAGKLRRSELLESAREKTAEARGLKELANPYEEDLAEARARVSSLKKKRKRARKNVSDLTEALSSLEFWARGFGPRGLPSYVLDSVMPFITERANEHLKILSDGDMSVSFSTQKEISSGEMRDEISISWHIEGIENYPPSGGQWKKIEVATNFALRDLVSAREGFSSSVLCLDECLDGMDTEGRQRVVDLLHSLRKECESIFVISHDSDLSEVFEKTLVVTKEDGVSTLEVDS